MAARSSSDPGSGYESRDLLRRVTEQTAQINAIKTSIEQQKAEVRKTEATLMTRIAGVDEDRKLAASLSQRTWQSNREEIDDSLKRQGSLTVTSLLLFGILVVGALAFFYVRFEGNRQATVGEIAELRETLQQLRTKIPDRDAQHQLTQEKLLDLSLAIKSISKTLDGFSAAAKAAETNRPKAAAEPSPASDPQAAKAEAEAKTREAKTKAEADAKAREANAKAEAEALAQSEAKARDAKAKADAEALTQSEAQARAAKAKAEADAKAREAKAKADAEALAQSEAQARDAKARAEAERSLNAGASGTTVANADAPAALQRPAFPTEISRGTEPIRVGETPYSLQLIGFFSLDELLNYARTVPLPSRIYYKQETYRGRPWFVLIHSLHADRESANATLSALPAELAKLDLWVRQLDPNSSLTPLQVHGN